MLIKSGKDQISGFSDISGVPFFNLYIKFHLARNNSGRGVGFLMKSEIVKSLAHDIFEIHKLKIPHLVISLNPCYIFISNFIQLERKLYILRL